MIVAEKSKDPTSLSSKVKRRVSLVVGYCEVHIVEVKEEFQKVGAAVSSEVATSSL